MKPTKTSAHSTATLARRLQTRLRYEKGLSNFSQALFLHALSAEDPLPGALKHLLHGTEASRVAVFENFEDSQAGLCARRICAVAAPGLNPPLSTSMLQRLPYHSIGERWRQTLAAGHSLQGPVFEFPAPEQALLQNQNILSLLVLPIFLGQSWFGFIVFDDCLQARTWSGEDVDLLRTASQILGAYFSQRRMQTLPVEDVEVRSGPLTLRGTTPRRRPPLDATAELLIAAERVLKEEKGFRQDFDPLQDGIFLVDLETAKFAAMNPAALDLYGFSNSEITMLGLTDISCGPQDALDLRLHVDKNPAGRVTPMHQRQKEGSVILVEIVSGTCTLDGKKFLLAAVREGEEEQGRISGRIEFSSEISGLPQNARHPLTDVEEILNLFSKLQRKILASTQSEFSFAGEGIYNDPAHPFLRVLAFARADHTAVRAEESMPEFKGLAFHHLDAVMTQMHQSGKPFLARCPEEAPFIDRLPAGHPPIRALLGLPIFHDNRLTGMIGLANRPGGYSSDIIQDLRPHVDTFGHLLQEYRETRQRLTMGA
ncbi:MAG: GAF domain-containing protein, partial [Nitrospinaceae bacterium]